MTAEYCLPTGNLEFGIARVIKALQPCALKLDGDTWYYAKRCLLALADALAKRTTVLTVSPKNGLRCSRNRCLSRTVHARNPLPLSLQYIWGLKHYKVAVSCTSWHQPLRLRPLPAIPTTGYALAS